jgi:hypothetical protein
MIKTRVLTWAVSPLIGVATITYTWAQEPARPPVVRSEFQKIESTVEAIDPTTRHVSLRTPNGPISFVAGPDVKNLAKVHVGDKVVVSYYQGIAAQLAKGGTKAREPAASTFTYRTQDGTKPGGGIGASVTSTVTIEAIDMSTHTVAFRRPDGSVHIVGAKSPNMVQFIGTLKPGDSVEVTYTESVAIDVVPVAD